jgi:hypothetical protein
LLRALSHEASGLRSRDLAAGDGFQTSADSSIGVGFGSAWETGDQSVGTLADSSSILCACSPSTAPETVGQEALILGFGRFKTPWCATAFAARIY